MTRAVAAVYERRFISRDEPIHVILSEEAKNLVGQLSQNEILRFAQNDMKRRPSFSNMIA